MAQSSSSRSSSGDGFPWFRLIVLLVLSGSSQDVLSTIKTATYIFLGWAGLLFASSDTYIKLVHDYVTGAADIDEITDRACDALSQNTFYPEVAPDLTSQPANGVLSSELKSRVVVNKTCEAPLTTSLCSNAPCFYTPDFGEHGSDKCYCVEVGSSPPTQADSSRFDTSPLTHCRHVRSADVRRV